jgi:hypothetical protein
MNEAPTLSVRPHQSSPLDDASKFEFQRDLEARKLDLEERKLSQARLDMWTKFIGTVFVGGLLTAGVTLATRWMDTQSQKRAGAAEAAARERAAAAEAAAKERAESAQRADVAVQLVNARERASADLRAQMFTALLENYFKNASDRERIVILELISLNFRDSVQIRPILELLDVQLREAPASEEKERMITELRRAGRLAARDQLDQVEQSKTGMVSRLSLKAGETGSPECLPPLKVTLEEINDDARGASSIAVTTNTVDGRFVDGEGPSPRRQFQVSYFDMPMLDYKTVKWPRNILNRYSITIGSIHSETGVVDLNVACLPRNSVDAGSRYAFDELLEEYTIRGL